MNKGSLIFFASILLCINCFGQDPQFSQFYAAPIYLNPAFTGGAMTPRITANYRNQWPSLNANFVTSSVAIDHFFDKYNSGVGLIVMNDAQGIGRLKSTDVGLTYSYMFRLDESTNVRFGMQSSYVSRSLDYTGLIFGYNELMAYTPITTDPSLSSNKLNYFDFSTGAVFYNEKSWFGVSVNHLTRPDQNFTIPTTNSNKLPMKFGVQGGLNIPLKTTLIRESEDKGLVITPAFLYKRQGTFNQLDLGFYATYSPLTLGLWYRGIPIMKTQDGLNNNDAVIFLVGYRMDNFSFGYSYDLTVSKLGSSSGGAHEISLSYQISFEKDKKKPARQRKKELSCPKF